MHTPDAQENEWYGVLLYQLDLLQEVMQLEMEFTAKIIFISSSKCRFLPIENKSAEGKLIIFLKLHPTEFEHLYP